MRRVSVDSAVRWLITGAVGVIGAAAGFTHTHDAALHNGQDGWLAWADAVVIESMVVVAGLELARERKTGGRGVVPLMVLVVAFVVQMGAQVSGAPRTFAGWLFAALPALGCLVCVKFAFRHRPADELVEREVTSVTADRIEVEEPAPVPEIERTPEPVSSAPVGVTAWPPR